MEVLHEGKEPEKIKVVGLDGNLVEVPFNMTGTPEVLSTRIEKTTFSIYPPAFYCSYFDIVSTWSFFVNILCPFRSITVAVYSVKLSRTRRI